MQNPAVLSARSILPLSRCPATSKRLVAQASDSGDYGADPASGLGDWRAFRNSLIQSEKSQDDARTGVPLLSGEVTEENQRLFECQNPRLSAEALWAHEVGAPEAGGLLLSSDQCARVLKDDRYWQLVIYLVQHSPEGSIGLILNRPAGLQMRDATPMLQDDLATGFKTAFEREPIYLGGFEDHREMSMMHGITGFASAAESEAGICFGGMTEAIPGILEGKFTPSMFKFFIGSMKWGPGKLSAEAEAGAWICAAAARSVVLKQCMQLPVPLWKEVLCLMGDEYKDMAHSDPGWDA